MDYTSVKKTATKKNFADRMLKNSRLPIILLSAFITVAVLIALVSLPWLKVDARKTVKIAERDGLYSLTGQALKGTLFHLAPGTIYYPNTYLTQENADSATPESVSRHKELQAAYLSQRFIVELPDNNDVYTLTFASSGRHAMRVYVNGQLAGQTGRLGTTKQETEVWGNNITCSASPTGGRMDIVLHSAQFHRAKKGAGLAQLYLGKSGTIPDLFLLKRTKGLLVMGVLLSAVVLLLSIYLLLSRTKATLYFALACVVMMMREGLQSQAWMYFPVPGNLSFMLEYLSVALLAFFISLYLGQYITGKLLHRIWYIAIISSGLYGIYILLSDSILYTSVLSYYQILLVACLVPITVGLFWNMRHPTKEQAAAMYGIAVFFLAALFDILMYNKIFGDRTNTPISETAMLVFVLAQIVSLFLMNNRVLAESKETEQQLAAEKEALEGLNRMKTEFLGNISHELKTPLTVMSGYAQTTRQLAEQSGQLDKIEVTRRMKLISSEADRLSMMVGQILDVTRMEEGRMTMERVPCYVDEIIHKAVETHYPILNKNANQLEICMEEFLPIVCADPARIGQVIINLISNAVRFTTKGIITVSARRRDTHILVCVADTGTGIAQAHLDNIFHRYGVGRQSSSGQSIGTGLGLYICKHIVELHGGKIWLESKEGKGTSVFFTLPLS